MENGSYDVVFLLIICALLVIAIVAAIARKVGEARAMREMSSRDSDDKKHIRETIENKREMLEKLDEAAIERVGHDRHMPEAYIYCGALSCDIGEEEYQYDSHALKAINELAEQYQQELAKWESRQMEIQAEHEIYINRYKALRERIEALDGTLHLKEWHVNVRLPKKHKPGQRKLKFQYSEYDYCLLYDRLTELERLYEDRKLRVFAPTRDTADSQLDNLLS